MGQQITTRFSPNRHVFSHYLIIMLNFDSPVNYLDFYCVCIVFCVFIEYLVVVFDIGIYYVLIGLYYAKLQSLFWT